MDWIIYKDGVEINQIRANESFVKAYCENHGYTYVLRPTPPAPEPEYEPTDTEVLNALLGVTSNE